MLVTKSPSDALCYPQSLKRTLIDLDLSNDCRMCLLNNVLQERLVICVSLPYLASGLLLRKLSLI